MTDDKSWLSMKDKKRQQNAHYEYLAPKNARKNVKVFTKSKKLLVAAAMVVNKDVYMTK
jgi:hypothetical protein